MAQDHSGFKALDNVDMDNHKIENLAAPTADDDGATKEYVDDSVPGAVTVAPVGSVLAWLKSYTNTPALSSGWVECNGQVLSDGDSVYDGQTIPNLNGGKFLRGASTSGGTGGTIIKYLKTTGVVSNINAVGDVIGSLSNGQALATFKGAGANTINWKSDEISDSRPPYYNVVWIMKVK